MTWILDERELSRLSYMFASLNHNPELAPRYIKIMRDHGVGPNLENALQKLENALQKPDLVATIEILKLDESRIAREVTMLLEREISVNGIKAKK